MKQVGLDAIKLILQAVLFSSQGSIPRRLVSTSGSSGILLAYAGGLMGIMVSPVHLCLVLTKKYFGASFKGLYMRLLPVVILASILVFAVKYLFYPN